MIYPMHCTWLNRHIIFNNNTFHQKQTLFFKPTVDSFFLTWSSRYYNADGDGVCRFDSKQQGDLTETDCVWGGVRVQKITRLPTSLRSKSGKEAFIINIYVYYLSVFIRNEKKNGCSPLWTSVLGQRFPHAPTPTFPVALAYIRE